MIGQVIAAVTGTVGFSVLYSVPRAYYPYCGFIGGAGWFLYCLLIPNCSPPEATLLAAILVVLLSRLFAVKERCPVTIFLISAIVFVFQLPQKLFQVRWGQKKKNDRRE